MSSSSTRKSFVGKVVGVKLEDNCILDDGLKEIVIPDDSADRYNF